MVQSLENAAKVTAGDADNNRLHLAACACAVCINQQLDRASSHPRSNRVPKIVNSLSIEELRNLPSETRRLLKDELSSGYASAALKKAVKKILEAELVVINYQPGIAIKGSQDFVSKTRSHLDNIAQTPMGKRLLRSLFDSDRTVTIVATLRMNEASPDNFKAALPKGKVLRWRSLSGRLQVIRGDGTGSGTTIKYSPGCSRIGSADWQKVPPGIWLGHELIHADDAAHGRMDAEEKDGVRNYERQAIGLPPYDQKEFTENKLRAQWAEPQPARSCY